jgi:hypothetical protein
MISRDELFGELAAMQDGGSIYSLDFEMGQAAVAAGQAVLMRRGATPDLPDKDAEDAADPRKHYKVPGQEDQGVKDEPDMA